MKSGGEEEEEEGGGPVAELALRLRHDMEQGKTLSGSTRRTAPTSFRSSHRSIPAAVNLSGLLDAARPDASHTLHSLRSDSRLFGILASPRRPNREAGASSL